MSFSQPVRCRRQAKNSYLIEDVYKDGRLVWDEWPAGRVTITMPGMRVYSGERVS